MDEVRAFIAIELPEEIKDNIESLVEKLRYGGARFVDRDKMHITLQFFGNIDEKKIGIVSGCMDSIAIGRFNISVKGLGTFGGRKPNVLFAKIAEGEGDIENIYNTIGSCIKSAGMRTDERKYTPHVTIARLNNEANILNINSLMKQYSDIDFGRFECSSIILIRSTPTESGYVHSKLHSRSL